MQQALDQCNHHPQCPVCVTQIAVWEKQNRYDS